MIKKRHKFLLDEPILRRVRTVCGSIVAAQSASEEWGDVTCANCQRLERMHRPLTSESKAIRYLDYDPKRRKAMGRKNAQRVASSWEASE